MSAAPRTAAGSTSRTCAGSCASSPSTGAAGRPSGRGGSCSWSLRLRALVWRRGRARRQVSRGRALPRVRRRPLAARSDRVPPARVRDGRRAGARVPPSRGRSGSGARAATLAWALAALFVAWAVVFALHGSIRLAALGAGADRVSAAGGPARPGAQPVHGSSPSRSARRERGCRLGGGVVLGWLLWHVEGRSPATGSSTRRACGSSSSSATCTCARSTSSRTAGSIPATPFRSGTASSRSSRGSRGLDPGGPPARGVAARAARVRRRLGVGRRRLRLRVGGLVGARRLARRSSASPPGTAARTSRSRCRGRPRGSCSCRPRSRSSSPGSRRARVRRLPARRRLRRARARPSDLRALRAAPARRLRAAAAA